MKRISPEEAKVLLEEKGYVYLDVRTVAEFESGHVPGAWNLPILLADENGQMMLNPAFVQVVEKSFGKAVKCVTGCQRGGRSLKAAEMLAAAGFRNVVDMRGGFDGELDATGNICYAGWARRNLPIEREAPPDHRYEALARSRPPPV